MPTFTPFQDGFRSYLFFPIIFNMGKKSVPFKIKPLFFLITLIGLAPFSLEAADGCLSRVIRPLIGSQATEYINDSVELIWYPRAGYVLLSHYELGIDGKLYSALMGLEKKTTIEVATRAAKSGGKGFFRFKLRVTADELDRLKNYVDSNLNKPRFQMCVGGVCKVITKNTRAVIPFPFSKVPTLNAIYLTVAHKLGYSRIVGIEYVGKSAIRNLITTEIPYELWFTYQWAKPVGLAIVWAYNERNELIRLIVPIESNSSEEPESDETAPG
ncbi:MAG: hypothetical protein AB1540_14620 [Bdellovibrionota bacterium]